MRTAPWQSYRTFSLIDQILTQIERTEHSDATPQGEVIFQPLGTFDLVKVGPAIEGFAETFEIYARRTGRDIDTSPLHRFVTKITHNSPLFQSDIDATRECARRLTAIANSLTRQEAANLVRDAQTKFEIEALPRQ
jgi:hypothetical protein